MTAPPRVVIAAATSDAGKTTLTMGLIAALRAAGEQVAPFKIGPDYIDPGYHSLAAGRVGRNLDAHLCGEQRIVPLLLHGAAAPTPASIAVIEGVMGLFDGRLGTRGFGSSAHLARLTGSPVVLVLDGRASSGSLAAVARGMATHDPRVRVAGVIVNRSTSRVVADLRGELDEMGLPLLGALPASAALDVPARHLGLVPAAESETAAEPVEAAGALVAEHVDLDAVRRIAAEATPLDGEPWCAADEVTLGAPTTIGMLGGRAFTFRYAETAELLRAAGCTLVEIDPLTDASLPADLHGLYLGGGFPEVHAAELSANASLRADIAAAVAAGLPTVAECAGLLYLARSLDGVPMVGAVDVDAAMTARLTLGYHEVVAPADTLLARAGERFSAHEFHRTAVRPFGEIAPGWTVTGPPDRLDGVSADPSRCGRPTLHASYQHLHWAGAPRLAARFAAAAAAFGDRARAWTPAPITRSTSVDPLTHHGTADVAPGLLDLAVNVRRPTPRWLREVIGRIDWSTYPDPEPARAALAERHGVTPDHVLPTNGASEAFTLIARAIAPAVSVVVHPQFSEPERALVAAGHRPLRAILRADEGFALDPALVDGRADLVVIGNPTNPTGVLHPRAAIEGLRRPGRTTVVDEAFMDAVPGERETLVGVEGTIVVRSLTKTWGVPGLRAGYVVADPALIARFAAHQPAWPVSAGALAVMVACARHDAMAEQAKIAAAIGRHRRHLTDALRAVGFGVTESAAPFVLVDTSSIGSTSVREALACSGFAVRRGETFPGLTPHHIRSAVHEPVVSDRLVARLSALRDTASTSLT